ncbi:MAG TPA: hypothetical protein VGV18_00745, partial [Verrucomicrobiae bacterium]|nr:hypothetical protein [Verrucomicrobiae bacterium]
MENETEIGPAETSDGGGHSRRGRSQPAPLQSRAKFLENWSWPSVTQINSGLCERGRAQRGINSETHAAVAAEWEKQRASELTLLDTFRFLKSCHRRAPFLFFNGNTFAEIGRALANALFSDISFHRRKEASSVVAHFITGVLHEDMMINAVDTLSATADWKPGDRVKTLRGSLKGKIVRMLEDGKIVWQPNGMESELIALPESLCAAGERGKDSSQS